MSSAFEGEYPSLCGDFMSQPTPATDPFWETLQELLVFFCATQSPEERSEKAEMLNGALGNLEGRQLGRSLSHSHSAIVLTSQGQVPLTCCWLRIFML